MTAAAQKTASDVTEGFAPVDWSAPLDPDAYLSACPPDAEIRGMFSAALCKLASEHGVKLTTTRFVGFKLYPLRDHMQLLVDAAPQIYPGVGLREAMRRFGGHAMGVLGDTMIGRVFQKLTGANAGGGGTLRFLKSSYASTRSRGTGDVIALEKGLMTCVALRDIDDFADSLHVGIIERVMADLGNGHWRIEVRRHGLKDIDIRLSHPRWQPPGGPSSST